MFNTVPDSGVLKHVSYSSKNELLPFANHLMFSNTGWKNPWLKVGLNYRVLSHGLDDHIEIMNEWGKCSKHKIGEKEANRSFSNSRSHTDLFLQKRVFYLFLHLQNEDVATIAACKTAVRFRM